MIPRERVEGPCTGSGWFSRIRISSFDPRCRHRRLSPTQPTPPHPSHVERRAKRLKVASEELKLPQVTGMAAGQLRERDWCNVVTAHAGAAAAYTWRLVNGAQGEHALTPPEAGGAAVTGARRRPRHEKPGRTLRPGVLCQTPLKSAAPPPPPPPRCSCGGERMRELRAGGHGRGLAGQIQPPVRDPPARTPLPHHHPACTRSPPPQAECVPPPPRQRFLCARRGVFRRCRRGCGGAPLRAKGVALGPRRPQEARGHRCGARITASPHAVSIVLFGRRFLLQSFPRVAPTHSHPFPPQGSAPTPPP